MEHAKENATKTPVLHIKNTDFETIDSQIELPVPMGHHLVEAVKSYELTIFYGEKGLSYSNKTIFLILEHSLQKLLHSLSAINQLQTAKNKMRTSAQQFEQLVNFMERHGDLQKHAEGPRGRLRVIRMWEDLTNLLNLDVGGDHKSVDKWKKVWSDFKNNTKRKAAKIQQNSAGNSGSASRLALSDLEQRVLRLTRGSAGPNEEIGVEFVVPNNEWAEPRASAHNSLLDEKPFDTSSKSEEDIKLQNLGRSGQSTPIAWEMSVSPAASPAPAGRSSRARRAGLRPSALRRAVARRDDRLTQILRMYANESLRMRRRELEQQAQWQTLFGNLVDVLNKFLNK